MREADEARRTARGTGAAGAQTRRANEALSKARELHQGFVERLRAFRVLDPACGSGNFLYLALKALKDLEHAANVAVSEFFGDPVQFPAVGPESVRGIEINPYAAELARVSVWIGEIQWMRAHGFDAARNPILEPLETIECRDALLNEGGTRAEWPAADVVIGNPPFLGGKRMLGTLGSLYVDALRSAYREISPFSDLVCWWFHKAATHVEHRKSYSVGLVSTNSIRGGRNRLTLDRVQNVGCIYYALSDEPWVVDGAAVRVSLICFSALIKDCWLDGAPVDHIFADLTSEVDLGAARPILSNRSKAFIGVQKTGPFDVPSHQARQWLTAPINVNARPNSDVLKPYVNGAEIVRRPQDRWIVDFGTSRDESNAALYELPFEYATNTIRPVRQKNAEQVARDLWWVYWRPRPEFYEAARPFLRVIMTPRVSKFRLFVWRTAVALPDSAVVAIARDDDTTFGILHSKFHELWSLRMGTWLGKGNDPRYTPSTTFETFPFPEGLTPDIAAADYAEDPRAQRIAKVAERLNELRENWLNPPDLTRREPEVVLGYPDRILPVDEAAAKILKDRTLTKLYNARPAWLDNLHRELDRAVAAAYGWEADLDAGALSDDEILARLFALNQERAAGQ